MRIRTKGIIGIGIVIILLVAWAPWMNNEELKNTMISVKSVIDGTNNAGCEYSVRWVPFGRYVASCEGGYFVSFWGRIV